MDRDNFKCRDCRWCDGTQCRFFDTNQKEMVAKNEAPTCPFYEDVALGKKLDKVIGALYEIAERLEWLQ